jgi:hypothetical protein
MRVMPIASVTAVVLLSAVWPARSQSIPNLNVEPVCRGIAQQAADPSETGGPDLKFARRMVGVFAVGKNQLYRRADGRNGELHRSRQLP